MADKKFEKRDEKADKETAEKTRELYKKVQRRLIAAILSDSTDVSRVLEILTPEDFEEPAFEIIFSAIMEITRRNDVVSSISIVHQLETAGLLREVGGPQELFALRDEGEGYLEEAPIELYAQMVKESSSKTKVRTLIETYSEHFTLSSGIRSVDGISELQSSLNEELYKLSDESTSVNISEDFSSYLALLKERKRITEENKETAAGLQGIPSLLPSLNHYTGGWLPGQLITVGARTGVGKSVFAVNCAVAAAQAGKSVLFFSLEMSDTELQDRVIASTTGINLNKLKHGALDEADEELLQDSVAAIETMKIEIETEARITVDAIRAKALRKAQSPEGLDFIVVDYLQLITPVGRFSSRQEAVSDISRNMKLLAKQLGVPVMVLVQVNREDKNDENPIPKLHQIRESGAIAQDSDIVILLHRDESLDDTTPHTLILLEKNRGGEAQKTVRCHSILECSLFREVTKARDVERVSEEDHEEALNDIDLEGFEDFGDIDENELF